MGTGLVTVEDWLATRIRASTTVRGYANPHPQTARHDLRFNGIGYGQQNMRSLEEMARNRVNLNNVITHRPDMLRMVGPLITKQVRAHDVHAGSAATASQPAETGVRQGGHPCPRGRHLTCASTPRPKTFSPSTLSGNVS
jgi:hypothetical protein